MKEEVEELLPRSVYFLGSRKEEPPNFNYLHEKCILRSVVNLIQSKTGNSIVPKGIDKSLTKKTYKLETLKYAASRDQKGLIFCNVIFFGIYQLSYNSDIPTGSIDKIC